MKSAFGDFSASYVSLGRGKYHVHRDGQETTVCGRAIEFPVRTAIYKPSVCSRCASKAPELVEEAERARKSLYDRAETERRERLGRNRRGEFVVLRCKLCGAQHQTDGDGRGAVAYCMAENHPAELEEVEVKGPAWPSLSCDSESQDPA